ncbi:MAG: hypothetical protein D6694_08500 [Gammaproteobacteria bacterium]|nr:MAG: hypothetical protein D6694_08500 [Gammaproteobacteria bacterium]
MDTDTFFSLAVSTIYVIAAVLLFRYVAAPSVMRQRALTLMAAVGWLLQGWLLHRLIDTSSGQNLSLLNVASMVGWLMIGLSLAWRQWSTFPLIVFTVLVANIVIQPIATIDHGERLFSLQGQPYAVIHVLLALTGYSFLALSAIHALTVLVQDHRLKQHQAKHQPWLPPILSAELWLFRLLVMSFVSLTLSYLAVFAGGWHILSTQPAHKLVLSLLSWGLVAALIAGHRTFGWRGPVAARWTLAAFILLVLAYFGTWAILSLRTG